MFACRSRLKVLVRVNKLNTTVQEAGVSLTRWGVEPSPGGLRVPRISIQSRKAWREKFKSAKGN